MDIRWVDKLTNKYDQDMKNWEYLYIICNEYSAFQIVRIPLKRGVLDTTLCDKVCQRLATGRWFCPGTLVSSTNKTDRHDKA